MTRVLSKDMNISSIKGETVFEIIVPSNASFLQFDAGSTCYEPTLDGYYDFYPAVNNFKNTISQSPYFENNSDWIGNIMRAPD